MRHIFSKSDNDDKVTPNQTFSALDHMDVNAYLTPSSSSSVSIYPCWPLCRGELSPSGAGMGLWLWGAAGWGCCTPEVLLHFCPTSPTPLHQPSSAYENTRAGFAFLVLPVARCNSARRRLSLCPHSAHPQWWSTTLIEPLVGHPASFCDVHHYFCCLTAHFRVGEKKK